MQPQRFHRYAEKNEHGLMYANPVDLASDLGLKTCLLGTATAELLNGKTPVVRKAAIIFEGIMVLHQALPNSAVKSYCVKTLPGCRCMYLCHSSAHGIFKGPNTPLSNDCIICVVFGERQNTITFSCAAFLIKEGL